LFFLVIGRSGMKRTIVRLIAVLVGLAAGFSALAGIVALSGAVKNSTTRHAGNLDVGVLFATIAFFLLWIAIGLFRFRRWALIATIILVGLCSVYSFAKVIVSVPKANSSATLIVLASSVVVEVFLIYATTMSSELPAIPGSRPVGVTAMAIVGFVAILLGVLTISTETRIHAAPWQLASTIFNMLLCAALSLGLWKVKEWARLLTEVTEFLAPLSVLPLLLGINRHRPFIIVIVVAVLAYAAWTVWYLRRPQIERAFAKSESITLCL
jgi:hypothetical protein